MKDLLLYLKKNNLKYFENKTITPFLSMKIGGIVRLMVIVNEMGILSELISGYLHNQLPYILLGGGSNVIFSDDYSDFVVIINQTSEIGTFKNNLFPVNSGVLNRDLLNWCKNNNISGLEFLAGIPGTIGGAAAVNAGAFGHSISEILERAEIINEKGEIKTVDQPYFQFGYRHSIFKTGNQIILNIFLKGYPDKKNTIQKRIKAYLKYRRQNHPPYSESTAGCFFKNPQIQNQRISAGKIIEKSGLKGMNRDNLAISGVHANFIINQGKACFEEIVQMEKMITNNVFKDQGIHLEREVIYISSDGKKY